MAENKLVRANPLANRVRRYAGTSVIFRQEAAEAGTATSATLSADVSASSPVVPGFVWVPAVWSAAESVQPGGETTAVPSPATDPAAPSIQRQPESPAYMPHTTPDDSTTGVVDTVAPATAVVTSEAPASTLITAPHVPPLPDAPATITEASSPADRPLAMQRHAIQTEPPTVQLTPAEAASVGAEPGATEPELVAPDVPAPQPISAPLSTPPPAPSLWGRIGQRLGRLTSRPQPPTVSPTASSTTGSENTDTAVPIAPVPAPQPATTVPATPLVQQQPLDAEPDRPATPALSAAEVAVSTVGPLPGAAPLATSATPRQPQPETPTMPMAMPATLVERQPATAVPALPATPEPRQPEMPDAPTAPATPVQRQPETAAAPTAVPVTSPPPPSASPPPLIPPTEKAVVAAPATPTPPIQRQPATGGPSPIVPAAPVMTIPTAVSASPPPVVPPPVAQPVPQASLPPRPLAQSPVVQPSVVQPQMAQPPVVQRQPEASPPSTEEDRNWRRLETIMRRHKEQEAAEEAAGSPETVTPSTAVDSSEVALPSFARPQPAAKPTSGVVSRQPAALPREAPMVAVARGRGPVTGDTAVPATSTPSPDEPVRLSAESPVVTPVEFSAEAPKLQAALADDTLVALPQEMNITVNAESKPAMDAASLTSSPLQTVWPVQTVQRETTPPTPLSPEAAPFAVPSEPPVRPPTPQDFWVEERLAAVPPGMPTDSSVPLLRPRRPRPGRATPPVAGVMAGSPPLADATTAVSPTVQRQTEAAVGLVPTEIGTLPPDLWTLIGQQPPEVTASREVMASPEAMAPAPPMSAGSPVVQRSADGVATAVPPLRDAPTSSPSVLSDYIQLEEGEEASRPTAAPGEGGEETAEKKENEEIDINELARQVYAHIRNQLTIDKERERGRLIHKW